MPQTCSDPSPGGDIPVSMSDSPSMSLAAELEMMKSLIKDYDENEESDGSDEHEGYGEGETDHDPDSHGDQYDHDHHDDSDDSADSHGSIDSEENDRNHETEASDTVDSVKFDPCHPFMAGYSKMAVRADMAMHIESPLSPGLKCEVKEYEVWYNMQGEKLVKEAGQRIDTAKAKAMESQCVMACRKYYQDDGSMQRVKVKIYSPHVRDAIGRVVQGYPDLVLKAGDVTLSGPTAESALACLFHNWRELKEYGRAVRDTEAKAHLRLAVKFVEKELARPIQKLEAYLSSSEIPRPEYRDLWMLFKPGSLVFSGSGNTEQIQAVVSVQYAAGSGIFSDPGCFVISCKSFAHNGRHFGYISTSFEIAKYEGKISQLPIYPLRYHPKEATLRERLVARGKKYCALSGVQYRAYSGRAWFVRHEKVFGGYSSSDVYPRRPKEIEGRIMIDPVSFGENMTDEEITLTEVKGDEETITENDYITAKPEVAGFSLTEKRWCWFLVDCIDDIRFDDTAFESLLLSAGRKRIVRGLTKHHVLGHDHFDDMLTNKGKGCVFLLHGDPGVGKTATVEGVADEIKRPVYVLMASDLGAEMETFESNLRNVLKLAMRWKAIVLLDEADVFLEKRSAHDLERNSIVSIFLRVLEYFGGVLFLTTNRVESLDPAFQSRIHLVLAYKPLDLDARKELWRFFLRRTSKYDAAVWTDAVIDDIARIPLNGRQIKNTARTANALALAEGSRLGIEQIRVVLESTVVDVVEEPKAQKTEEEEKREVEKEPRDAENGRKATGKELSTEAVVALGCLFLLVTQTLFLFYYL